MTHIDPEEILRRELRAAAESIEPAVDGLSQIRARLSSPRPLAVAWVMVGWTTVGQPALVRLDQVFEAVAEWLRPVLHPVAERLHPVTERLHPVFRKVRAVFTPRTGPGGRRSPYAWLRPALALAGVIAVVVVGGFALAGVPNGMLQQVGNVFGSSTHGSHSGGRGPGEDGGGSPGPTPGSGSHTPSPSPSASCSPTPRPTPSPTPTPTVSPSPTPTAPSSPTPTAPSSPSPSPSSPSPTPTDSAGGGTSSADSQSAQDTSLVVMVSPAHRSLVAKPRSCGASSAS
jgi:hypothetical protein